MAVQKHGAFRVLRRGRRLEDQDRCPSRQSHDLDDEPAYRLRANPALGQADNAFDVSVRFPRGVEVRRFRRNANVIDQLRNDFGVPMA